jgi:peptidoglycan/LPS O-acetylase OafA/YrhL
MGTLRLTRDLSDSRNVVTNASTTIVPRDNIDALTGLRFVAAFTIALGHYYQSWLEISGIGMPLFFTLSGFIIHYVYARSFRSGWGEAATEFAVARFSRIYPLYLALLIYAVCRTTMGPVLSHPSNLPVLLAYLLGCWTWWPFTVDGHTLLNWQYHLSWSVSTELFFYVAYALFLYRIVRIRSFATCVVSLLVFCVFTYLLFYGLFLTRESWSNAGRALFPIFTGYEENFGESFYRWALYFSPYARIFEFIGGCLTAQAFLLARGDAHLRTKFRTGIMASIAIVAMFALWGAFFYNGMRNPWLQPSNTSLAAFLVSLHMNFLLAPTCYLLIFSLALGGSIVSRVLGARIPRFLGDISYSTYLSHMMAEGFLARAHIQIAAVLPPLIAIFAVIYALSWLLYSAIEVPAKRLLRQVLRTRVIAPARLPDALPEPQEFPRKQAIS